MKTVDAIQSAPLGVQELVLQHYGYEVTGTRHVECPFCGQKKFRINYAEKLGGQYAGICVCGSYPLIKLAEHRSQKTGKDFLDEVDFLIGNTQSETPKAADKTPEARAWDKLRSGTPIKGTPAHEYLRSRGINILPRHACVYIEREPFYSSEGDIIAYYGAIYSILTNEAGRAVKEHITYLDGPQKARPGNDSRKMRTLSNLGANIAARIYDGKEVLAVGEGLESCLSYSQLMMIPALPTMNTANLKNYRAPDYVKTLHIVTDHDHNAAGLAAASACAHANILQRPNLDVVYIDMPKTMGFDFNDALINGDQTVRLTVCRK